VNFRILTRNFEIGAAGIGSDSLWISGVGTAEHGAQEDELGSVPNQDSAGPQDSSIQSHSINACVEQSLPNPVEEVHACTHKSRRSTDRSTGFHRLASCRRVLNSFVTYFLVP